MSGRILGLDYGTKTVGVAISDPLLLTAQELETITRERASALRHTLVRIKDICEEYGVELIVLGYPRNMDDSEGFRCEDTLKFKELLEKRVSIPITLVDERLTTVYADEIAAAIILQDYLDNRS